MRTTYTGNKQQDPAHFIAPLTGRCDFGRDPSIRPRRTPNSLRGTGAGNHVGYPGSVTAPQQPRCDLPLATRDGRPISNSIDPNPAAEAVALAMRSAHVRLSVAHADQLQPATGRYNCHGLVFASRRTNIPAAGDDIDIAQLLRADGYERVLGPRPGDVVAYVDPRGEIEHTGFVSAVEQIGSVPVVHVWSAWGGLGEFRHRVDQTPYSTTVQYWRIACR